MPFTVPNDTATHLVGNFYNADNIDYEKLAFVFDYTESTEIIATYASQTETQYLYYVNVGETREATVSIITSAQLPRVYIKRRITDENTLTLKSFIMNYEPPAQPRALESEDTDE